MNESVALQAMTKGAQEQNKRAHVIYKMQGKI